MDKHNRLQVFKRAEVTGEVFIHNDDSLFQASIVNLSAGGVFLNRLMAYDTNTPVRVVIKARGLPTPIQAIGKVVRVEREKKQGMAVEFTSISRQSREQIQNCVLANRMKTALKSV